MSANSLEFGESDRYSCKMSAYWWYCTEWLLMTMSIGETHIEKNIGSRTQPCGTPSAFAAMPKHIMRCNKNAQIVQFWAV